MKESEECIGTFNTISINTIFLANAHATNCFFVLVML